jgi:flagellar protein FlbT
MSGRRRRSPEEKGRNGRLMLEVRAGDRMVVNGAALQFVNRCTIALTNEARFLFGKQLMMPEVATTPARRLYFAMQSAYVADVSERELFLTVARARAAEYMVATTSETVRALLREAMEELEAGRGWEALRRVRDLFAYDDVVLNIGRQ